MSPRTSHRDALLAEIERLHGALGARLDGTAKPERAAVDFPVLDEIASAFGLSSFERDLLLLCAATELDSGMAELVGRARGLGRASGPSFSVGLSFLDDAHWSALSPSAPLRRFALVELDPSDSLTRGELRIDESVLHRIVGLDCLDPTLARMLARESGPRAGTVPLPGPHARVADEVVASWRGSGGSTVLHLIGRSSGERLAVARSVADSVGARVRVVPAEALPVGRDEVLRVRDAWERQGLLDGSVVLLECDRLALEDPQRGAALRAFVDRDAGPLVLSSRGPLTAFDRSIVRFVLPRPSVRERMVMWRAALGDVGIDESTLGHVATHFDVDSSVIEAVAEHLHGGANASERLWAACRVQARQPLDGLAECVEPRAGRDDLVLAPAQFEVLDDILVHARRSEAVHADWGFARSGGRGCGVSALFAGPSGTGKSLAAEVVAGELGLDLYRVDLSSVVDKYIGETEKNLARVFDAAEAGGAVLLFDEADALFGRRSEVRDSHDRHANVEVSYLLQRMEAFDGIAILTTNMREALDSAFTRRLQYVVEFGFPGQAEREALWERAFPPRVPRDDLVCRELARLDVAGGNIRNIALTAAVRAAEQRVAVGMRHVLYAARRELVKLGRPTTGAETEGWVQ